MNCEICNIRKAVYPKLCEHCAEGIRRLVVLEQGSGSLFEVKIRCYKCLLMCRNASHYLNHDCEPNKAPPAVIVLRLKKDRPQ
jgi:hypothetical protein